MNKLFVPYKESIILKDLGFNEVCFGFYNNAIADVYIKQDFNDELRGIYKGDFEAPLYQQAFRWFREKYEIHSYIERLISGAFIYKIDWFEEDRHNKIVWECKSYSFEESELECLKKLIEIIKNK